jgi:hypothetical protein
VTTFRLRCSTFALALLALVGTGAVSTGVLSATQTQVTAMVTVVSESGDPVTDLTPADFIVRERKTTHQVARVDRIHQVPLVLTILFDISKPQLGTPPPVTDMRDGLASMVASVRAENPSVQIALTEVAGAAVPTVPLGAAPEDLDKAISRLFVGQQPGAVLIEGLLDAARSLTARPEMRKVILLVDFGSHDPTRVDTANQALREIQNALATVWSVSIAPSNAGSSPREAAVGAAVKSTGGLRLTAVSASGLKSLLDVVADSLASQYLVTFTRDLARAVSVDDIQVESKKGQKVLVTSLMR